MQRCLPIREDVETEETTGRKLGTKPGTQSGRTAGCQVRSSNQPEAEQERHEAHKQAKGRRPDEPSSLPASAEDSKADDSNCKPQHDSKGPLVPYGEADHCTGQCGPKRGCPRTFAKAPKSANNEGDTETTVLGGSSPKCNGGGH